MNTPLYNLKLAAILGLLVVIPFVLLELTFSNLTAQGLPALKVLFGMLWLLSTGFIFIVLPIIQNLCAGNSLLSKPLSLVLRITSSGFIAVLWLGLVIDQMPCFLGVPNCD